GFRPPFQAPRCRPVGLARFHHPRLPARRAARAPDPRARHHGDDVEPDDLREGALRGDGLRRAARRGGAGRRRPARRGGAVRARRDHRRARRVRPLHARVRGHARRRRLRLDRGVARGCRPGRGHGRRGPPALGDGGAAERDGEGPRHGGGRARGPAAHRRRHQRERDAPVRARRASPGDRGVPGRARGACRPRRPRRPHRVGRQLLRQPRGQRDRPAARRRGRRGGRRDGRRAPRPGGLAPGPGGDREREARVPPLPRAVLRPAVGRARPARREPPAPALGEHEHQEPGVPRRPLRRAAHRPGHGEHPAAGDRRRLRRPRRGRAHGGPRGGARRADGRGPGAPGDLDAGGHRPAARRGAGELPEVVRRPRGGVGAQARRAHRERRRAL
ncbi:MAG: Transaldolase, partial [uncultured Gemmatimonadaceae bacterium]